MDEKRKSLPVDSKVSKEPANLVIQDWRGGIDSEGINHAVPGRCFGFDHVIDPTGSGPYADMPSVAHSGKFSSDRTITEYASDIWKVEPCPVP
jgi:hypothetical protein